MIQDGDFSHLKHCILEKIDFRMVSHGFLRRDFFLSHGFRMGGVTKIELCGLQSSLAPIGFRSVFVSFWQVLAGFWKVLVGFLVGFEEGGTRRRMFQEVEEVLGRFWLVFGRRGRFLVGGVGFW